MSDEQALDARRRRLMYRSRYTGMKETDLLLGAFARAHLAGFTTTQLDRYEALLETPEPDLLEWIGGRVAAPAEHDHDVLRLLAAFKLPT